MIRCNISMRSKIDSKLGKLTRFYTNPETVGSEH